MPLSQTIHPPLLIAGLAGGSGKTLAALSLISLFRSWGLVVAAFKKGPDFIDPAWLSLAAGTPCRNLDVFIMGKQAVVRSFNGHSTGSDVAVVEGNRGLFDGMDGQGTYSTAVLAKLIKAKVVLTFDCTKMTGTAAALVKGCQVLDPGLDIAGVILSRTGGERHVKVLTSAIRRRTGLPVLGAIPRLGEAALFERHLGLMPPSEHKRSKIVLDQAGWIAQNCLNHNNIKKALGLRKRPVPDSTPSRGLSGKKPGRGPGRAGIMVPKGGGAKRVGVFRDRAFNFYYPENLEVFRAAGAEVIFLDAIRGKALPQLDFLYIGGGFPETSAAALEKNRAMRLSLKREVERGLPVYAECGGVIYLGRKLYYRGKVYEMAGVFPLDFDFSQKPKGHGYAVLEIVKSNPFFKTGMVLKGHEFHYTGPREIKGLRFAANVRRGYGFDGRRDGLVYKSVFAAYTHLHATAFKNWAQFFIHNRKGKK